MTEMLNAGAKCGRLRRPRPTASQARGSVACDLAQSRTLVGRSYRTLFGRGLVGTCGAAERFTDLQEDAEMTPDVIKAMRLAAWEDLDPDKRGDLPILLGEIGLADYSQDPHRRGCLSNLADRRHGSSDHLRWLRNGRLLEWSASKHNLNGTGTSALSGTPSEYHTARLKEDFFR